MDRTSRRFGQFELRLLKDGIFEAFSKVLTHTAGAEARQAAIAALGRRAFSIDVNCFALRGPDGPMLIDAGTGTAWGEALGHARAALVAEGLSAGEIRRVLVTHLHGDHALGLFDGDEPYFPQAEIWVPRADFAFFTDAQARASLPKARQGGFDIAERLLRLYDGHVRLIDPGEILPGIELHALPGHTPGHCGYLIRGEPESAMLWGDAVHLADLQAADPDIGLEYDLDRAIAAATRRNVLAQSAREGWLVSGGHIHGFGRVRSSGSGFEIAPT
ncbi:MBL fold metallo-hydrolase [Bosea sp. BK604]|uniref:AidB family quorum-quenching N-acyl homoserine lactonase n=1 Tax=Bosea sp. BK604 TaxID=2512180 RepID=UPI0010446CA6|nr:MBL fold metallo-hydrolase [Bosea sp. BK604]TCR61860.1 glyoxylase-like metal-dependent hydrolase (beta-lactamase superfamily II) [Bosea sp. BK604]